MKKLLFALAVLFAVPFWGNSQSINWMTFEEAIALNKKEPRKIIVDVYTDWCGWCKKLDNDTYSNPEVINYINKKFYAVKFNAETKKDIVYKGKKYVNSNRTHPLTYVLAQSDNVGYPTTVFLDEKNNVIKVSRGYMDPKGFLPVLKYIGSNAYKTKTFEEYKK